jgi:hypothetical protein
VSTYILQCNSSYYKIDRDVWTSDALSHLLNGLTALGDVETGTSSLSSFTIGHSDAATGNYGYARLHSVVEQKIDQSPYCPGYYPNGFKRDIVNLSKNIRWQYEIRNYNFSET